MIATVIMLVVQLLPGILAQTGVVPAPIAGLITSLGAALPNLVSSLTAGNGPTTEVLAILAALKTEIAALTASGTLSPASLSMAASLEGGLTAALSGYSAAQIKVDPSTLTPLPEDM